MDGVGAGGPAVLAIVAADDLAAAFGRQGARVAGDGAGLDDAAAVAVDEHAEAPAVEARAAHDYRGRAAQADGGHGGAADLTLIDRRAAARRDRQADQRGADGTLAQLGRRAAPDSDTDGAAGAAAGLAA